MKEITMYECEICKETYRDKDEEIWGNREFEKLCKVK